MYLEDCVKGMPLRVEPGSVDVVVTSPPYNLGIDYGSYNDKRNDYLDWSEQWLFEIVTALSPVGSLFLNFNGSPSDPWLPLEVADGVRRYLYCQNVIHWVKSISIDDGPVRGHVKPVNSPRFLADCHEYIFHFTKDCAVPIDKLAVGVPYADKSNLKRGGRGKNGDVRCRGNVWFIPYETVQEQGPHPAIFPVDLPRKCILLHGLDRCRLVMDPFMGIGTTGRACDELGVDFVGFEVDENYYREALNGVREAANTG